MQTIKPGEDPYVAVIWTSEPNPADGRTVTITAYEDQQGDMDYRAVATGPDTRASITLARHSPTALHRAAISFLKAGVEQMLKGKV